VARVGRIEPLPAPPRAYSNAVLSPDGRRAAVNVEAGTVEIAMYDFARGALTTVATPGSSQAPRWTADGARITYRGTRAGSRTLWWKTIDTGAAEEQLLAGPHIQTPAMWSRDGQWLVYSESHPATASDIWTLERGPNTKPRVLVNTSFTEGDPRLSPDGRWLAYTSDEPGREEVFVQPFPEAGPRMQISSEGGTEPVWSRDGRELFYLSGSRMMAVAVEAGSAFQAGAPRALFEGRFTPGPNGVAGYDVAADGRFLMVQPLHPDPPTNQIQVVLNWSEELRRRVN
jgi:Tol biopolymer transport system component